MKKVGIVLVVVVIAMVAGGWWFFTYGAQPAPLTEEQKAMYRTFLIENDKQY